MRGGGTRFWPVLYFRLIGIGGFIDRKKHKKGRQPFFTSDHAALPFGFEIGKFVKYAGLNSHQLDLLLGKTSCANSASSPNHPLQKPWTSRKSDAEKSRYISPVAAEKRVAYQSLVDEISVEEMRTPRNKSKFMPGLAMPASFDGITAQRFQLAHTAMLLRPRAPPLMTNFPPPLRSPASAGFPPTAMIPANFPFPTEPIWLSQP